ncbi:MAG: NAD(P)-dependent oxidoreductase [Chloroflexi bacterium]|uniref:NAD(P)-dependent oxidoreductase n=2 Tax=Candidatus Chlorohelix allophototropha TaxID=3003348 RepID=A0A8T7MA11_9CHLR|nr:NAD(P)-dependent oxidoreductase [Chloroflexota bacterium]WJW68894.1 NAD(P)-dependent oxidoreductase [Chloroflexota bacterium L227-S17]
MTKTQVGFIGLGIMGRGMALNLLKAGFPLTIYARNPQKVQDIVAAGALLVNSSREVAEKSEITITIVPDSPEVLEVILGQNGALEGAQPGSIIIDMSTINPATSRNVAEHCNAKGVHFMDAPVSGGSIGAQTGTLAIMAGGDASVFQRALPIFQAMGRAEAIYHVGVVGSGEVVKIVNNVMGAIITAACGEALAMGVKAGVEVEKIAEIVTNSSGSNWQLANAFPRNVFSGAFKPGFFTELMYKDVGLALQLAEQVGTPATMAQLARGMFESAIAAGYGRDDYTSVVRPVEAAAGVELRAKS